jgi:hypothetical protein
MTQPRPMPPETRNRKVMLAVLILTAFFTIRLSAEGKLKERSDTPRLGTPPSIDTLLRRMSEANIRRESLLAGYSGVRTYKAENGFTRSRAETVVKVTFRSPAQKKFQVISESGTKIIRTKVFKPALEAETEAQRPQVKQRSAVNAHNYELSFLGEEEIRGRLCYLLNIRPRRKDKFLLRGQVWIDSQDFAIVRVQGHLVKLPSFWTRKVEYRRDYQKIGDIWLPLHDQSTSQLFMFGKSTLTIDYTDFQIELREIPALPLPQSGVEPSSRSSRSSPGQDKE